jgi:replicative DNA helicase
MESEHIIVEEKLMYLLLNNLDAVRKWATSTATISRFDKAHELLLRGVMWSLNENVKLTRASFKTFAEQSCSSPQEVVANMTVYSRCNMRVTKADELPMLLSQITDSYRKRKTSEFFNQYNKSRDKVGEEEANHTLANKLLSLESETRQSKTVYVDLAESKEWMLGDIKDRIKNPRQRLLTGLHEIDHTMAVGAIGGGLTIFCAPPGTFKTTVLMNIALNIFETYNENVCYFPLEGPYEMFLQKIVSRETKIPFNLIDRPDKLSEDEIKNIADQFDKWQSLGNRFRIIKPGDRSKVSTIKYEVEKRIDYFQPRAIFVDYFDNLIPDVARGRSDLELRDLFEDLIRIGDNYKCHIFSAAKLGREAIKRLREAKDGNKEMDTSDVHGGQEFGGNAMAMYGQIRNAQEPSTKLDLFCMKSRYGPMNFGENKMKATLVVRPDIGLITSEQDVPEASADDIKAILDDSPF